MASQQDLPTSVATLENTLSDEPRMLPTYSDASSSHTRQSSSHSQLRPSSSEIELSEMSRNTPARNPASAQLSQSIPENEVAIQGDPPQSISPAPSVEVSSMPLSSTNVISISAKACYQWLQSTLGILTLVLALVSLLVYNVRSYRLAIWTARNDEIQACTGMIQARPEQPVNSNCEKLLSTGPQDPPYSLIKRGLQNFLMKKSVTFLHGTPTFNGSAVGDETQTSVLLALALIFLAVFVADISIAVLCGYSRTGVPFDSPVRLEMPGTWKEEEIGIPLITTGVEYVFQERRKRKGRLQEDDEKVRENGQKDLTSTPSSTDSEDEPGVAHCEKRRESETESEDDEWVRQHQLYPMKTTIPEVIKEQERVTEEQELALAVKWGWSEEWLRSEHVRLKEKRGRKAGDREKLGRSPASISESLRTRRQRHSYKRNRKDFDEAVAKIPKGHTNPRPPKKTPSKPLSFLNSLHNLHYIQDLQNYPDTADTPEPNNTW